MLKRILDAAVALVVLVAASPLLLVLMFLVWRQDGHSPLYIAMRVGKEERPFNMVKLRSMIVNADKGGVDSTAMGDNRITPIGHFIRRYKLDELMQCWNVLCGDMSLVGPRPNVKRETDLYTPVEKRLLSVKPGITDLSSIVFADEGAILAGRADPDIAYNQLIRPWKSRLALIYVDYGSFWLDLKILWLTGISLISPQHARKGIARLLQRFNADENLIRVALRRQTLLPSPPPGAEEIVTQRA